MKKIHLYHISRTDLGPEVFLTPDVPANTGFGEDEHTPRVCACLNVPGCLQSGEFFFDDDMILGGRPKTLYVYEAWADPEDVWQPSVEQVPDAWFTGELWVTRAIRWTKVDKGVLRKHLSYTVSCKEPRADVVYSRFAFTFDGYDEVVNRAGASPVYGDADAFSVLAFDPVESGKLRNKQNKEDKNHEQAEI